MCEVIQFLSSHSKYFFVCLFKNRTYPAETYVLLLYVKHVFAVCEPFELVELFASV